MFEVVVSSTVSVSLYQIKRIITIINVGKSYNILKDKLTKQGTAAENFNKEKKKQGIFKTE